jgi:hypothetical protein
MSTLNERLIGGNLDGTSTPLPLPSRYQVVVSSKYPAGNRRETISFGTAFLGRALELLRCTHLQATAVSSKYPAGNRRETGTLGYSYLAAAISSKHPTGNRREMVSDPMPTP